MLERFKSKDTGYLSPPNSKAGIGNYNCLLATIFLSLLLLKDKYCYDVTDLVKRFKKTMVYMQMYDCTNMTSEQVDDLWQRLGDQLELLVLTCLLYTSPSPRDRG